MPPKLRPTDNPPFADNLNVSGRSVRDRIRQLFLLNLGKIVTREQIIEVAGAGVENWHQRLSELRTDEGYTILAGRDRSFLKNGWYMMETAERRDSAAARVLPTDRTWTAVLLRSNSQCEWNDDGIACRLRSGDTDPIGGGTVRLTPDHMTPHEQNPDSDPADPTAWRALCGRHQVVKKNFWDNASGKLNTYAIVQAAPESEKRKVFNFLMQYYNVEMEPDQ